MTASSTGTESLPTSSLELSLLLPASDEELDAVFEREPALLSSPEKNIDIRGRGGGLRDPIFLFLYIYDDVAFHGSIRGVAPVLYGANVTS